MSALWFCLSWGFILADYWMVWTEIQEFSRNSTTLGSRVIRYLKDSADSFGGNFSTKKRFSYYDHEDDDEIPCGFLTRFPVSDSG